MQKKIKTFFLTSLLLTTSCLFLQANESVSPKPYNLTNLLDIPVTNSMVTSWVVSLLLILVVRLVLKKGPTLIPSRGQAVLETLVEGIKETIEPIVGKHMVKHTFPILIGFFTFILIQNWAGLIPGVGAFGHYDEHGHLLYYFRPGNADLNMTLALAIVSFIAWGYFVFRYAGTKALAYELFGNKADKKSISSIVYYLLFVIFFAVGFIELISILFRLVSLSFRLFGNVFGGENLLTGISGLFGYILPVPFYFLETLIGLIQAFVFTLLVAIYIGLVCNHEGEEHSH